MLDHILRNPGNVLKPKQIELDNNIKKYSGKYVIAFLMLSFVLVSSNKYYRDPLICAGSNDIPIRFMESRCYDDIPFVIRKM